MTENGFDVAARADEPTLRVLVRCTELPGARFDDAGAQSRVVREAVHLGIQRGTEVIGAVPASDRAAEFIAEFRVGKKADGSPNFLGPFAQGSAADRFFYLSWGTVDRPGCFTMFRRLKIRLGHLRWPQIRRAIRNDEPLIVTLRLTDAKGGPLCATPPKTHIEWKTEGRPSAVAGSVTRAGKKAVLLSGGNPRIAKGDGDASVQAYIAAIPGWKRDVGRRLDALIARTVPDVRKAVKWNSPFYGVAGQGWFLSIHCFAKYVKVAFFRGASLRPLPPGASKQKEVRYLDVREDEPLDEKQFVSWIAQAAPIPGWDGGSPRSGGSAQ